MNKEFINSKRNVRAPFLKGAYFGGYHPEVRMIETNGQNQFVEPKIVRIKMGLNREIVYTLLKPAFLNRNYNVQKAAEDVASKVWIKSQFDYEGLGNKVEVLNPDLAPQQISYGNEHTMLEEGVISPIKISQPTAKEIEAEERRRNFLM